MHELRRPGTPYPPGARLFFYIDLIEACDRRGQLFPLHRFGARVTVGEPNTTLDSLLQHLVERRGEHFA